MSDLRYIITYTPKLRGFSFAKTESIDTAKTITDAVDLINRYAREFNCPVSCFTIYDSMDGSPVHI